MMGGRVAEEMIFGTTSTSGAQSDIEQATRLARMMVTRWGFSPELGAVSYARTRTSVPRHVGCTPAEYFGATAMKIDSEVRRLVEAGHEERVRFLKQALRSRSARKGLLEFETLSGDEIIDLLNGKKPNRESMIEPSTPRSSAVPSAGRGRPRPDAGADGAAAAGLSRFQ